MIALLLAASLESNAFLLHDACFKHANVLACSALPSVSNRFEAAPSSLATGKSSKAGATFSDSPGEGGPAAPLLKPLVIDGLVIGGSLLLDYATTKHALENCGNCQESNAFFPTLRSQSIAKAAAFPLIMTAEYLLRSHGKKSEADGVRYGALIAFVALSVNNIAQETRH